MLRTLRILSAIGLMALFSLFAGPVQEQEPTEKPAAKDNQEEGTMPQEKRSSNRIDYVEIPVTDVQRAKKFYGEVFGWDFVDYGPDYASFHDGRLDGGLSGLPKDTGGGRGGPLVVFYDASLKDKVVKIKEAGGQITKEIFEFPGGSRFHFLDPDGNEFAIWSE